MSSKSKPASDIALDAANKIISLLGIDAQITASEDEKESSVSITIDTQEPGLLIGRHGETIDSFQSILALILRSQKGEWYRVTIDIAGWRDKQEERLKTLAIQAAEKVKQTGNEEVLYNLTPAQRRVIHLFLSQDQAIETRSEGEGKERYLVIAPKP